MTPHACNAVCRAHGFRYAAVWGGGECSCGSSLGSSLLGHTDIDGTRMGAVKGLSEDTRRDDAECAGTEGFPGDRLEACGTESRARVFVDPSFGDGGTGREGHGYGYLACFADPGFSKAPSNVGGGFDTPSAAACFESCADRGMTFVAMSSSYIENRGR